MLELPVGFFSSALTVFLFYPYRDYVKFYPTPLSTNFVSSRFKGLATNPSQLSLLALPNTFMLGIGGSGDMGSLALASVTSGFSRRFLRTLIYRMGERTGSRAGVSIYASNWDAVTKATASYGVLSWCVGGSAVALTQMLSSGLAIASVGGVKTNQNKQGRRKHLKTGMSSGEAFFWDWWSMFRSHAFFMTVSAPVRNALSTAIHVPTRGSGYISPAVWATSEVQIYKEAALVSQRMLKDMGIRYFFQGTIRSVLKVSLPFGFNYAVYKNLLLGSQ